MNEIPTGRLDDARAFCEPRLSKRRGNQCRPWKAGYRYKSYPTTTFAGESMNAHRLVYMAFVGPIPAGYHVDHLCCNIRCCNPEHLEAVTPRENQWRKVNILTRKVPKAPDVKSRRAALAKAQAREDEFAKRPPSRADRQWRAFVEWQERSKTISQQELIGPCEVACQQQCQIPAGDRVSVFARHGTRGQARRLSHVRDCEHCDRSLYTHPKRGRPKRSAILRAETR